MMHSGKLEITDREQFELYLQKFKDDTEMEVTVSRKYKRRSSGQGDETTNFNGYYWAVIVRMVSDQMGELDDDYTHNLIQIETGNIRRSTGKGFNVDVPKGTKEMSGGEFAEYCSRARMWASKELGLNIPEPNQIEWTY